DRDKRPSTLKINVRIHRKFITKCWVRFIVWLGRVWSISSIATENEFWNAGESDAADNCYGANPFPPRRSKRQKSKTISEGGNSTEDEKRASEVTVDAAASGGVEQT